MTQPTNIVRIGDKSNALPRADDMLLQVDRPPTLVVGAASRIAGPDTGADLTNVIAFAPWHRVRTVDEMADDLVAGDDDRSATLVGENNHRSGIVALLLASCLVHAGMLAFLNRDEEAVEAFNRGLDVAPLMPQLSVQLGYVLLRRKLYADAKTAFGRALANSAGSPEALFALAKVHQAAGDNAAAAGYFRQCLTSRPNDGDMWLQLGYCLLELGDRAAGYECFRTATRGDPQSYGNALSALVKSGRGRFWLKPSRAAQYFRGARS